ncbi:hypothetical protein ASG25_20930 [Rhizobium sp. Leaf384]|uniref:hypothetical protein n=1 Tax=unclassified Rhizobium TaxID=2613769 RepID=UPI000713F48D|nr:MULTISPECIES: hypothetical protein [unclassified Rhizobium]KQR70010.1 hypothetical protein ASG03_04975 [Rhizobium sp. Leaf341]KQS75220.1 hypothetical protein ASG25_20930 [Rhizobium sp. Leaf384]KQS85545.1 hypothetical protein ASG58_19205 [Rhizobium sp. Leaf383]
MDSDEKNLPAAMDTIIETYSVSPDEAERIVQQFGDDEQELALLLGHEGATKVPSPNTANVEESYVLFDI